MYNTQIHICRDIKNISSKSKYLLIKETILESVLIYTIIKTIAEIINDLFVVYQINIFYFVGLCVSILSTYYKYKILIDPSFKPCQYCTQSNSFYSELMNGTLYTLDHEKSFIFGVPNSIFGILFYIFMMYYNIAHSNILFVNITSFVSVVGSFYLWKVMIFEIKQNCILSMIVHTMNFTTLYYSL